jgi:predicted transposase/invertase (TIGR01784 family)
MNPIEKLKTLREFLNSKTTSDTVEGLSGSGAYVVKPSGLDSQKDDAATAFLTEMVGRFDEIKVSFPKQRFDGRMDFVCKLDTNEYALVEMQVISQDYWDRRALAYVAAFYGNQLSRGQAWKHIRKVIGVNILGGGKEDKAHWVDTPGHFMRHYKFEDQLNGKGRYIDGIELIQYSIMQAPTVPDQEKQDWLTFFKEAHYMSEEDVKSKIKTPAVLQAFERAKISKLPAEVQEAYEAEDEEYDRYSQHTADQVNK